MSTFKTIEKLGLKVTHIAGQGVVSANNLELILQSAQVVYGSMDENKPNEFYEFDYYQQAGDTHRALLLCLEPIIKKTKAEMALELLQEMLDDCLPMQGSEHDFAIKAKRILEMKP